VFAAPARAQSEQGGFSVALRKVSLHEALSHFSRLTGEAVSFDPTLIDRREAYCAIERADAEAVLGCILASAGLDYIRLSSGTYVIVSPALREAVRGSLLGQVIDLHSGRPLADAHVYLASADRPIGTITRGDGQFALPALLPGRYVLTSSFVGYRDWRDTLVVGPGEQAYTRIEMDAEPVWFTPVIIDGLQRRIPSERLIDEQVALRDSSAMARSEAGRPFASPLASLPGVRINDVSADIHIQGGEAGEHRLRLDGAPVFLPRGLTGVLSPFSPLALDRVVVHKSGFDAERGSHLAGVTEMHHAVEGVRGLDIQVDPLALNARLGLSAPGETRRAEGMVAARRSLEGAHRPEWLFDTLNQWGRPDAFLLLAPLSNIPTLPDSLFEGILSVGQSPEPTWSFRDLHAAGRVWTSPLNNLRASYYAGGLDFSGALPSLTLQQLGVEFVDGEPIQRNESVAFAVDDAYQSRFHSAQATFNAVLGAKTLASLQGRVGEHTTRHVYTLLDSLETILPSNFPTGVGTTFLLPTRDVSDRSHVVEAGIEGRIEQVLGRHMVTFGAGSTHDRAEVLLLLPALAAAPIALPEDPTGGLTQARVSSRAAVWQHHAFLVDRITWGARGVVEAGLRLTYLPTHEMAFAEPRLSVRFDWPLRGGGSVATRTAAGLYRQYLSTFDVSTLNAGALLPSMRVWLPADRSLQPPKAFHLAQSMMVEWADRWSFRAEGYVKWLPQSVTLNYLYIDSLGEQPAVDQGPRTIEEQASFLAEGRAFHAGGSASLSYEGGPLQVRIFYDRAYARRRSPQLFGGRSTTLPWVVPHRLAGSLAVSPFSHWVFSARGKAEWGRSWAFRQAYYDYFGQQSGAALYPPFDLSSPDRHILAPFVQLDLGAAFSPPIGRHRLQIRLESLNVLNRRNEVDWRLVFEDGQFRKRARHFYPRSFSLAARWMW
jgi:hypothetical protein